MNNNSERRMNCCILIENMKNVNQISTKLGKYKNRRRKISNVGKNDGKVFVFYIETRSIDEEHSDGMAKPKGGIKSRIHWSIH